MLAKCFHPLNLSLGDRLAAKLDAFLLADNTAYRKQLPADVQKTLDEHEAAGTTDSQEYQDAVMVFYKRHLCQMDPWPQELLRAFELANFDLYVTMWGNTEFNATGTLKDYDGTARLVGKLLN